MYRQEDNITVITITGFLGFVHSPVIRTEHLFSV